MFCVNFSKVVQQKQYNASILVQVSQNCKANYSKCTSLFSLLTEHYISNYTRTPASFIWLYDSSQVGYKRLGYLSDESRSICEHMVVNVSVLHHHGSILVVSVNDQGQSYSEGSREKDTLFCELSYQRLHRQPSRENTLSRPGSTGSQLAKCVVCEREHVSHTARFFR